jgi:hypothetical protein
LPFHSLIENTSGHVADKARRSERKNPKDLSRWCVLSSNSATLATQNRKGIGSTNAVQAATTHHRDRDEPGYGKSIEKCQATIGL